jgi:hypothetical protein
LRGYAAPVLERAEGISVGGPYFEDFEVGQVFDDAPALTLTSGHPGGRRPGSSSCGSAPRARTASRCSISGVAR